MGLLIDFDCGADLCEAHVTERKLVFQTVRLTNLP